MTAGNRLRLLFVVPFPPRLAGTHGGAKVVGQLLARTAERHRVAALYLRYPGEPGVDDALGGCLELVEEVARPAMRRSDVRHWIAAVRWRAALLGGRPRLATELTVRAAASRLRATVGAWRPDVVRLEYPVMGAYLPSLRGSGAPRVLADYDVLLETARLPRSARDRAEHLLDLRAWRRLRRRVLADVDAAVVPTELDRRALVPLAGTTEVACIPFGTDVDFPALDPAGADDAGVLFVGNFNHTPNVDAAIFLAREILPLIRRERPDATLRLVGERPPDGVAHLPGVEVTGQVRDLRPLLDDAAVVVAPLRLGAGMRVKVIEALVAGKAVVASSRAVEGLALEPGRHALVADDPVTFATAVSSLLADRARRVELAGSARDWARAQLGWENSLDRYDELYARLLARRRR